MVAVPIPVSWSVLVSADDQPVDSERHLWEPDSPTALCGAAVPEVVRREVLGRPFRLDEQTEFAHSVHQLAGAQPCQACRNAVTGSV